MASVIRPARIALMAIATATFPDDTTIWYGKRLAVFNAPLTFQVYGWAATRVEEELSPRYRVDEQFDFSCCISSFEGDQDFDARELECMTQFDALTIAVNNNYTLNNTVRWAHPTDYEFIPDTTAAQGQSMGTLDFKIHCEQRIESLS